MASLFRIREASLLVHYFDLPIDHLAGKSVYRHVHPVVLLTFDNEVGQIICAWRISTALCYNVDHQVPCACLRAFAERACERLSLCFWQRGPEHCLSSDPVS